MIFSWASPGSLKQRQKILLANATPIGRDNTGQIYARIVRTFSREKLTENERRGNVSKLVCVERESMSIRFTQFLRPDGRQRPMDIDRPAPIEQMAAELARNGYGFEIEILLTEEISMEVCDGDDDSLACEICVNGPAVPAAVDRMITAAHKEAERRAVKAFADGSGRPANR